MRLALVPALLALFGASAATAEEDPPVPQTGEAVSEDAEQQAFLGVDASEIPASDFDGGTVLRITRVFPSTTAATLGLEPGDILLTFHGRDVSSRDDLRAALEEATVGAEVTATWRRGDTVRSGSAELGARRDRRAIHEEVRRGREQVGRLQEALRNQSEDLEQLAAEQATTGAAMLQLALVLEQLPDRLQAAADEFKLAYPEGEFEITVEISIRTHPEDDATMVDLSPENALPDDEATGTDSESTTMDDETEDGVETPDAVGEDETPAGE